MESMTRREFLKNSGLCFLSALGGMVLPGCAEDSSTMMKENKQPSAGYVKLHQQGLLKKRGLALWDMMTECQLCPRQCRAKRLDGQEGFCRSSAQLEISAFHPHMGEEPPLVGKKGSGTIFFTNCNLRCVFCINWEISLDGQGQAYRIEDLAKMMLVLQEKGCHNINVVTPTHYVPHIVLALDQAAGQGLNIPLVYNTCGWETIEVMKMLDGIVDIYLPDFKYFNSRMAAKYSSGAADYPSVTREAFLEMQRQVGVARVPEDSIMRKGMMVRHLVMPNNVGSSKEVIGWIADNLPKDTYINIMSQYRPMYKAAEYPAIARPITVREYREVVDFARAKGLTNLEIQG